MMYSRMYERRTYVLSLSIMCAVCLSCIWWEVHSCVPQRPCQLPHPASAGSPAQVCRAVWISEGGTPGICCSTSLTASGTSVCRTAPGVSSSAPGGTSQHHPLPAGVSSSPGPVEHMPPPYHRPRYSGIQCRYNEMVQIVPAC